MDESWQKRSLVIQPNQVTGYLCPNDFRDVFGGPPRSVLLRHFSPSTKHANDRFPIMTRKDNLVYNTDFCKSEFLATIQCSRNGFHVTKREVDAANNKVHCKPGFATSTYYGDGEPWIMKRQERLPSGDAFCKLDHMSTTGFIRKRDEHPSFKPDFYKKNELKTTCDGRNSFRVMDIEYGSSYVTKSNLNSPTTYSVHNWFPVMKSEVVDNIFSEDAVLCKPISGQHPMTWSGNGAFQALTREEGFYDDIFGTSAYRDSNVGLRRSRSRAVSKSESESTAVSCCEDEFLPNSGSYGDKGDRALASFASKLRPITIPSNRYDSSPPSTISDGDSHNALRYVGPACSSSPITNFSEISHSNNSNHPNTTNKNWCTASSFCCFTPPETLSQEQSFRLSFKNPPSSEDNSPPSFISLSVPSKVKKVEKKVACEVFDRAKEEEEQNFGSEVNTALDEAIAWAKERFMMQDDAIVGRNENFVSFKDWNGTTGKYSADSKER